MSLQLAAQHLAAQGRGPDKQLVHMSPREVAGLQALAMAHGGSLTINPDTGLPEAGFLDNLLPMIIGAGVTAATGGAAAPWMIGLGIGGLETVRTGNLQKGLMAGLGAYGGAGLAGGLMGAGAGALDATQTALGAPNVATGPGSQAAMLAAQNQGFGQAGLEALGQSASYAKDAMPFVQTPLQSVTRGAQGLLEPAGREAFVREVGGKAGLTKMGLAAAAPMLLDATAPKTQMPELDREQYRYAYSPGRVENPELGYTGAATGERAYFRPSYTRLAAGGPVENMSAANVYDMQRARGGVSDMGIDNSTGMQKLADGGTAGTSGYEGYKGYSQPGQDQYQYAYDPKTQRYRDIVSKGVAAGADDALPFVDTMGGGIAMGTPDASVAANPATTIAIGQALQGYGQLAFAPGAAIAGMLGQGMVNSGINALGAMESQAEADAAAASTLGQSVADAFGVAYGGAGFNSSGAGGISGTGGNIGDASTGGSTVGIDAMGPGGPGGDTSGGAVGGGFGAGDGSGFAKGGISHLGDYSDGGRLLRGPGDGVSDSIPAMIGKKQPARLADGEFVVPARIVSELGNGSTDAGARKLYAMMDRIQKARGKTVGKGKVAKNSRAEKYLPA